MAHVRPGLHRSAELDGIQRDYTDRLDIQSLFAAIADVSAPYSGTTRTVQDPLLATVEDRYKSGQCLTIPTAFETRSTRGAQAVSRC